MQAAKVAGQEHPVRDNWVLHPLGYWPQPDHLASSLRLPFARFCDAILCVDNFKPGGINEHSYGADGPVIVVSEVSLLCTIPVSSAAGTLGPSVLLLALPLSYSSFRRWRNLITRTATPQTFEFRADLPSRKFR